MIPDWIISQLKEEMLFEAELFLRQRGTPDKTDEDEVGRDLDEVEEALKAQLVEAVELTMGDLTGIFYRRFA
jgi:hypothetical protein